MLEIIRKGQRWVTALFVIGIGGVFVFFLGLGGPLQGRSGDAVVRVGDHRIGIAEFERLRSRFEERYREALGDQFDPRALEDSLDTVTARTLVERAVLATEAERLGLTVAKKEIEQDVIRSGSFVNEQGAFDPEVFERWIAYEYNGSERAFREQFRRDTLAGKLQRVLQTQALVSEGEARQAVRQELEQVKLAFTVHDPGRAPSDLERDEAAIAAFLAEREAEARAHYEKHADRYNVPEQTRARHILLRVPPEASEEEVAAVEAQARELRQRLVEGEDFEELAEEHSEDPGSKASGGDLGFFQRGQMVPPFEEVAFELEPGTLSQPVRTDFGFHLIRVEERKPAESRSYEEVREDLAFELLGLEAAAARARAVAEELSEQVREGDTLETAARRMGLTLERTDWIQRRPDGYVPGLGAAPELLAVAFRLEAGESSPRIFEVGEKLALVQVLERQEPDASAVEARLEETRERLSREKLETFTTTWVDRRREQLTADGEVEVDLAALGR